MKRPSHAWGLLAGIGGAAVVYYALSAVSGLVYRDRSDASVLAYSVAPAADPAVAGAAVAQEATPAAAGNAAGEKVFKACKTCHTATKGGKNATGPNLWNVLGRDPGSVAGFAYSDALKARAGTPWDAATLDAFLTDPKGVVAGTKMSYAGLKKPEDRAALIAWLGAQNDAAPAAPAATEPAAATVAEVAATPGALFPDLADGAEVVLDAVPYAEGVTYANPPAPTDAEIAEIGARLEALRAELPGMDYQRARYHPMHFPPQINEASNEECLVCHKETLDHQLRESSIAGVKAADSLAWYQTLDTYAQDQADFHWRHMESDFAKKVMKLDCTFCHKGNDPRDETPWLMPGNDNGPNDPATGFTARKMVNPQETCLLCHGQFPAANMGLEGTWPELRADLETPEAPNGCLSCHAETFRTNRHAVTYLNAANIEEAARAGTSDTCFGCHGGRAWYRNSYPYPRHSWPGMDSETLPDWAADRPTDSKPEYQLPATAQ